MQTSAANPWQYELAQEGQDVEPIQEIATEAVKDVFINAYKLLSIKKKQRTNLMNSSVMQSMVKEPSTVVSSIRNTTKHTETCHGVTEEIRIEKRSPLLNLENKKRDKQELKQESQFSLFKTNLLIRVEKNFLGSQATFLQFLDWHVQTHFAATWKQP